MLNEDGKYMDFYFSLSSMKSGKILLGLSHNFKEIQHDIWKHEVSHSVLSMLFLIILAVVCLLMILISILQPLKKIQQNIRNYKLTKDSKAVVMSQNTVAKHVAGLIEKRLIYAEPTTVQTRKGKKHNGNLLYTIRPIQDAVDYYNERLLLKLEAATEKQCIQKQLDAQKQLHPDSFKEGGDCA